GGTGSALAAYSRQAMDISPLRVAVLGAGLMGSGIAAEYAVAGHQLRVTTSPRTSPEEALAPVRSHLQNGSSLEWCATTAQAAAGADIVIESLPEDLELKRRQLGEAQGSAPSAILCTNTSSFTLQEVGGELVDPTRLVGTHYLNPPAAFPIMELVVSQSSDPEVVRRMEGVLRSLGKLPIRVGDVPGFVINRLQFALLREAVHLVEMGQVAASDLDRIVSEGLALRWTVAGPLATAELGGPELFRRLAARLWPRLSCRSEAPGHMRLLGLSSSELETLQAERDRRLSGSV
ncbi:MAG: 3-hydroxyacyl-CoA dehydrogenase family protein, partial [Actinomycetota bacterium]|nr:3-hydroxyacyl-CoA dehydrogenase family protein [Actinomycetota bacterium]